MESLIKQLGPIVRAKGFKTITDFVNDWIKGGQTFSDLRDWLETEKGIKRSVSGIWCSLRPYLTIPYEYEDQFWYKWDAIAQTKGFKNAGHMVHIFKKRKMPTEDIAKELGVGLEEGKKLIKHLSDERINGKIIPKRKYVRKKFKMNRDRNGISHHKRREFWRTKLKKFGFRSLRDAIWRLKKRGYTYREMAKLFEVTIWDLKYRRKRAGL